MSSISRNPDHIKTVDFNQHSKLKVKLNPGYVHGKDRNLVSVNIAELGISASNFPHVFVRHQGDQRFLLMAMLGLKQGENIYYGQDFWESTHVPMALQRHPFVIGFDDRVPDSEVLATCLEMDSPFVNEKEGLALYDAEGKETEFMRSRHQLLNSMFEGQKFTEQFIQTLEELDLIVSLDLSLQLQKGEVRKVKGLYTVNEAKLKDLTAAQLKELQERNFLPPCYLILASLYQLHQLIRRRNRKGGEQIINFSIGFDSKT